MPFRRQRQSTDLERVARILRADCAAGSGGEEDDGHDDAGWVPGHPDSGLPGIVSRARRAIEEAAPEADDVARLDSDLRRARRPGLLSMPDAVRRGRTSVSSAAVVALVALVLAVGCVFVLRVLWGERSARVGSDVAQGSSRTVEVRGAGALSTQAPSGSSSVPFSPGVGSVAPGSTSGATSRAEPPGQVVVHVVGQVVRPGLVRLVPGARVADAIAAAGGARRGADLGALNLARVVVDGEQVHVPVPGEPPPAVTMGPGASGPSGGGSSGAADAGAPISLNTADPATLDTLPGVGPVLAQRIVDWRTQHGRFTSVDELGEVSGIGEKLMSQLRPRVTL